MAEADSEQTSKRTKRRLKAAPVTIRERQASTTAAEAKSKHRIRKLVTPLGAPFKKFYGLGVWQSNGWKPFKKVGRIVGLIVWPPYFRNSFRELQKVTWPGWAKSWRLTFDVLVFSIALTLLIAAVDYGLNKLFREVLIT